MLHFFHSQSTYDFAFICVCISFCSTPSSVIPFDFCFLFAAHTFPSWAGFLTAILAISNIRFEALIPRMAWFPPELSSQMFMFFLLIFLCVCFSLEEMEWKSHNSHNQSASHTKAVPVLCTFYVILTKFQKVFSLIYLIFQTDWEWNSLPWKPNTMPTFLTLLSNIFLKTVKFSASRVGI